MRGIKILSASCLALLAFTAFVATAQASKLVLKSGGSVVAPGSGAAGTLRFGPCGSFKSTGTLVNNEAMVDKAIFTSFENSPGGCGEGGPAVFGQLERVQVSSSGMMLVAGEIAYKTIVPHKCEYSLTTLKGKFTLPGSTKAEVSGTAKRVKSGSEHGSRVPFTSPARKRHSTISNPARRSKRKPEMLEEWGGKMVPDVVAGRIGGVARALRVPVVLATAGLALCGLGVGAAKAEPAYQIETTFHGGIAKHDFAGFGGDTALSGDGTTALVYTERNGKSKGHLWVYERLNGRWRRTDLLGSEAVDGPSYGNGSPGFSRGTGDLALSGNGGVALVGGCDESGEGNALVFTRGPKKWSKVPQHLVGTDQVGHARFGCNVALSSDGETALVGGATDDEANGAVWVFTRHGGEWAQDGEKLTVGVPGFREPEEFGSAMALSGDGDTALIGDHDRQCSEHSHGSYCEPFAAPHGRSHASGKYGPRVKPSRARLRSRVSRSTKTATQRCSVAQRRTPWANSVSGPDGLRAPHAKAPGGHLRSN